MGYAASGYGMYTATLPSVGVMNKLCKTLLGDVH
jgi:hypothetical protein